MRFTINEDYNGNEWTMEPIAGGERYYMESLKDTSKNYPTLDIWESVPYCLSGDYCGSGTVGVANYRSMKEDFGDHKDVCFIYGSYGSMDVLYRVNTTDEELLEIIKKLEDYPLIDEDIESEVSLEWENEAWESWGRSDFKRALIKKFTVVPDDKLESATEDKKAKWELISEKAEDAIDNIPDDKLWEIFYAGCEASNTYWESEQSGSYIDIDRVVKDITWDDLDIPGFTLYDNDGKVI